MKRMLTLTLTFIMIITVLSGCMVSRNPSGNENGENLVGHIQISSGESTILPFGSLIWSRIDNEDGTFTESIVDKYDVVDLVSGKTNFSVTNIPRLVLDEHVTYSVQVNGSVEKVYLLAPKGNEYTKTETTFDDLSNLTDGTYYVVLEVLLSGNCDPDAPQHSYRYEDVFCLFVGEQNIGTSDEEYKKIQFFPQPILEFEEESYDVTEFEWSLLSDNDMELLRQIYNDGKGWTDDSVVDRTPFLFDGRIRFATESSAGWMYFGFEQNVLYYNGFFTNMNEKVIDMINSYQKGDE